ncbi:glycosyl transferase family 2 [Geothermobacter ehrlichii]|uniref:Glycosyl transferase family 2 n=1 Tax=Geothermobacter ehrlichii TaxID=213224 RepID=A0A5D3WKE9_9BACT|nr:glycosyltransferase [Geothermobacter ehrlichii]TYO99484.1 glycosyl transferase family 2 [Geothermobacter ehrlichii]
MRDPAVSILMAVRDEARYLEAALASIRRQTLRDWELVAVDDGSTDATTDILQQAAAADDRIRVIRQPPDGLVAALNRGLAACRAELVARMDGDDICHPLRLEEQVAFLRTHPDIDLVACRARHFPRPRITAGMLAYEQWQNAHLAPAAIAADIWVESPFAHPSVCYRRQRVLDLGGYLERPWAEDYDLWLRMHLAGCRFARLPGTRLFWRDRPDRLTRRSPRCSLEAFRACRLHHLRQGFLLRARKIALWGAGIEGKAWRRLLVGQGFEIVLWIDIDPRKIGQIIHGAPVIAPDAVRIRRQPTLITIGARGAREQVRRWAARQNLNEGRDYLCVT